MEKINSLYVSIQNFVVNSPILVIGFLSVLVLMAYLSTSFYIHIDELSDEQHISEAERPTNRTSFGVIIVGATVITLIGYGATHIKYSSKLGWITIALLCISIVVIGMMSIFANRDVYDYHLSDNLTKDERKQKISKVKPKYYQHLAIMMVGYAILSFGIGMIAGVNRAQAPQRHVITTKINTLTKDINHKEHVTKINDVYFAEREHTKEEINEHLQKNDDINRKLKALKHHRNKLEDARMNYYLNHLFG